MDACKVVKGLEPKFGYFVTKAAEVPVVQAKTEVVEEVKPEKAKKDWLRCGCFQKWYSQIINFNRVFHYKPSILGYHHFWKHPCVALQERIIVKHIFFMMAAAKERGSVARVIVREAEGCFPSFSTIG